jgi:hypothetical protein
MPMNINHELARNPYTLEVLCDYLEEHAATICDHNLFLFLRSRQHEERYFSDADGHRYGDGCGHGDGHQNGDGYGDGYSIGDGYGCGYGHGNGNGYGDGGYGGVYSYGDGRGDGGGYGDEVDKFL